MCSISCPITNHAEEATIKGVAASDAGSAIFLGSEDKTIVIHVDQYTGVLISTAINGEPKGRPLTHDLIGDIFNGFGVSMQRVVINDVNDNTFYARIILQMENELGTKIVEIDARPSDSMVLAIQAKKPIFVARKVIDSVEDYTELLERIRKQQE